MVTIPSTGPPSAAVQSNLRERVVSSTMRVGPDSTSVLAYRFPVTVTSGESEAACVPSPAYDARHRVAPEGSAQMTTTWPVPSVVPDPMLVHVAPHRRDPRARSSPARATARAGA